MGMIVTGGKEVRLRGLERSRAMEQRAGALSRRETGMPEGYACMGRLGGFVEALGSGKLEDGAFGHWLCQRWPEVSTRLHELHTDPGIRGFVEEYSSILADQMEQAVLHADAVDEAKLALIDLVEELYRQTERYAQPSEGHVSEAQMTGVWPDAPWSDPAACLAEAA